PSKGIDCSSSLFSASAMMRERCARTSAASTSGNAVKLFLPECEAPKDDFGDAPNGIVCDSCIEDRILTEMLTQLAVSALALTMLARAGFGRRSGQWAARASAGYSPCSRWTAPFFLSPRGRVSVEFRR